MITVYYQSPLELSSHPCQQVQNIYFNNFISALISRPRKTCKLFLCLRFIDMFGVSPMRCLGSASVCGFGFGVGLPLIGQPQNSRMTCTN